MDAKTYAMGARYAIKSKDFATAIATLNNALIVARHHKILSSDTEQKLEELIAKLRLKDRCQAEQCLDSIIADLGARETGAGA